MAQRTDLTTLELARKIVNAVLAAPTAIQADEAVMKVLDEHGCWFCRKTETAQGTTFEQMELL